MPLIFVISCQCVCACVCVYTCVKRSAILQELWVFFFEQILVGLWGNSRCLGERNNSCWVPVSTVLDTLWKEIHYPHSLMNELKLRNVTQGHNTSLWLQSPYFLLNGDFCLCRKRPVILFGKRVIETYKHSEKHKIVHCLAFEGLKEWGSWIRYHFRECVYRAFI